MAATYFDSMRAASENTPFPVWRAGDHSIAPHITASGAAFHAVQAVGVEHARASVHDDAMREWVFRGTLIVVLSGCSKSPVSDCPAGTVPVPGGSFVMGHGSEPAESPSASKLGHPQHNVTLSGYCIDKTEVTVAAYSRCVTAGKCRAAAATGDCNGGAADKGAHPINCVDIDQASVYCEWSHGRLPTEAEWEYAARGADGRSYPWGNTDVTSQLSERANWNRTPPGTMPVGSFSNGASPFGALDMAGNVWEWVADWFGPYDSSAQTNPSGPRSGILRVVHGGGWQDRIASGLSSAAREGVDPGLRNPNVGFRCIESQ